MVMKKLGAKSLSQLVRLTLEATALADSGIPLEADARN